MDKRPVDIAEDNFGRVVGNELERGFISGEGELICYFHKQPPELFGQSCHVAGGEGIKRRLESPKLEAKNKFGGEMMKEDTLPKLLKRNYEKWGNREVAMRKKDFGIWQEYTWKDEYEEIKFFSLGLVALGLKQGDKISIIGENDPEWIWAMFAAHAAGGIVAGIFADSIPSEVKYIVEHSDSKLVVAHDQEQVDKVLQEKIISLY